jgi:hypothetical protein
VMQRRVRPEGLMQIFDLKECHDSLPSRSNESVKFSGR